VLEFIKFWPLLTRPLEDKNRADRTAGGFSSREDAVYVQYDSRYDDPWDVIRGRRLNLSCIGLGDTGEDLFEGKILWTRFFTESEGLGKESCQWLRSVI